MPTANPAAEEAPPPGLSGAFAFVSQLAQEVSCGKIELPSFPDVAVRVRKVLADEHVSNEQIARVVGSEAGLAARAHRQDSLFRDAAALPQIMRDSAGEISALRTALGD